MFNYFQRKQDLAFHVNCLLGSTELRYEEIHKAIRKQLTLKMLSKILAGCVLCLIIFKENKTWHFM